MSVEIYTVIRLSGTDNDIISFAKYWRTNILEKCRFVYSYHSTLQPEDWRKGVGYESKGEGFSYTLLNISKLFPTITINTRYTCDCDDEIGFYTYSNGNETQLKCSDSEQAESLCRRKYDLFERIGIHDVYELQNINKDMENKNNKNDDRYHVYFLENDIDASVTATWHNGAGFVPIRNFSGMFFGKDHKILGLYIDRPKRVNVGLFAELTQDGYYRDIMIEDVFLENVKIRGKSHVGGMVGAVGSKTQIHRCYVTGEIDGNRYIGGMIGANGSGIVRRSYTNVIVKGRTCVGTLIGENEGIIDECYAAGEASGITSVGGLVGSSPADLTGTSNVKPSYWKSDKTFRDHAPNSTNYNAMSRLEMTNISTYKGWDFENVWNIDPDKNDGFPYFKRVKSILHMDTDSHARKNPSHKKYTLNLLRCGGLINHFDVALPSSNHLMTINSNMLQIWDIISSDLISTHLTTHTHCIDNTEYTNNSEVNMRLTSKGLLMFAEKSLVDRVTGKTICSLTEKLGDESSNENSDDSPDFISYEHDCRVSLCGGKNGYLAVWDITSGKQLHNIKIDYASWYENDNRLSINNNILSVMTRIGTIIRYDITSFKEISRTAIPRYYDPSSSDCGQWVTISPDSRLGLTPEYASRKVYNKRKGALLLWDTATGNVVKRLIGFDGEVISALFMPDGQYIVVLTSNSVSTWKLLRE